tara:strand:- start:419 stop:727 length:309 start_codon:yes stop_codon:yes gene_type:complete
LFRFCFFNVEIGRNFFRRKPGELGCDGSGGYNFDGTGTSYGGDFGVKSSLYAKPGGWFIYWDRLRYRSQSVVVKHYAKLDFTFLLDALSDEDRFIYRECFRQ